MLWSLVLPVQITGVLLAGTCAAGVAVAPRVRVRRLHAALAGPPLAGLAFVPGCLGVKVVCDAVRFGEFHYATAAEVRSPQVAQWLPDGATDITVSQQNVGFAARYAIEEEDLLAWLDDEWDRWGEEAELPRTPPDFRPVPADRHRFRWADWPAPPDAYFLDGPHAANAAGFTIYYSPSEGRAYQEAGYW